MIAIEQLRGWGGGQLRGWGGGGGIACLIIFHFYPIHVYRGGQEPSHTVCSLVIQSVRGEACIFAVCKDHRLRVWSCKVRSYFSF